MKKTKALCEQQENKALIIRKLGFYDISAEFAPVMLEENKINNLQYQPEIKEDEIRMSDEVSVGHSMNESEQIEEPVPFENLARVKESRRISNKVLNTVNRKNFKRKNVAFNGMYGLSQPEINKIFIAPMVLNDIDDFTEAFLYKIPSKSILAEKEGDQPAKDLCPCLDEPKRISMSNLDVDDSNNQMSLKIPSPSNFAANIKLNADQDRSNSEILNDLPFKTIAENHRKGFSLIPELVREKREDVLKEPARAKINEEEKKQFVFPNEIKKDPNEILASEKQEINENTQEVPEAILEEKFVLNIGEITAESALDVQPKKEIKIERAENNAKIVQCSPPYKIKLIIIPTEWPVEQKIEENEEEKHDIHSNYNENQANVLMSLYNRDDNRSILSKNSKVSPKSRKRRSTTKRKPMPKRRSIKKKLDDNSSKISNESKRKSMATSLLSPDGSKHKGSKKPDNEGASAMGSVLQNSRRDEKSTIREEVKKQQEQEQESVLSLINKNQNQASIQKKPEQPWSGQEVLTGCDPYAAVWMTANITEVRIWQQGYIGLFAYIRRMARKFVNSEICENFMNILVIMNTVTLAMDRYNQPVSEYNTMENLNYAFTSAFTVELTIKLFGLGIVKYLSNSLNCLDLLVVLLSWVEIIFLGGGALSAFRTVRVFRLLRTVRVLRVARLLRGLQTMLTLMDVIADTIGSFGYIGLMLLIIMIIYALFGMALFAGRWYFPDGLPRPNFDSFNSAFISVFQLLTVENWPTLLYAGLRDQFQPLVALYFVSFLLIGGYILLNMFLAIMLDSFVAVSANQDIDEDDVLNK